MDEALPPIVGAEAEEIYQSISAQVKEINSEKANEFEQNWRTYLAFFAITDEDRLSKATEFYSFVTETFGEQFAADKCPQLVRLVNDAGKRQALHLAVTQAPDEGDAPTTQAASKSGEGGLVGGIFSGVSAVASFSASKGQQGLYFLGETVSSSFAAKQQAIRDAADKELRTPTYYELEQLPISEIKELLAEHQFWKHLESENAVLGSCIRKVSESCSPGESVVKAWYAKGKTQFGFDTLLGLVLTSTHYFRVTLQGTALTSMTQVHFNDVVNLKTFDDKPDVMRVIIQSKQSSVVEFARRASGDRAADLRSEDIFEVLPVGSDLEAGTVMKDILHGFQLVHRRFVTPPDNVAAISKDTARAFYHEFKAPPAAADGAAPGEAPAQGTSAPPAKGLFGGSA